MNFTFLSSGLKGFCLELWPVKERAPIVLPWKDPIVETNLERPVSLDNLSAASLASAPELQKKTRALDWPVRSFSFSASSIERGCE